MQWLPNVSRRENSQIMKTEVSDKRMKLNWNNKHQKEQFIQKKILKGTFTPNDLEKSS